jgi:hypothetical protein
MASYPGAIYPTPTLTDGVDTIQAAHPNALGAEINAIETQLGTNPKTIVDNATVGTTPTDVANFLDMVATRLRQIIGDTSWTSAVPKSLTQLVAEKLTAPEVPAAGDLMYYDGANWKGLHSAGAAQGYLLGLSAGLLPEWQGSSGRPYLSSPSGAAVGDLMRYDGSAWVRIPVGTTGQRLTVAAGVPVWASQDAIGAITAPALYDSSTRTWIQASTIQACIDAGNAVSTTQMVVVPPGTYTENLTMKANVPVVELIPGTVTIRGQVLMSDGCALRVQRVETQTGTGTTAYAIVVTCAVAAGVAVIDVGEILIKEKLSGSACVREGLRVTQGIVHARVGRWYNAINFMTTARLVSVSGGTLYLQNASICRADDSTTWTAFYQVDVSGGAANIYGGVLFDDATATALRRTAGTLNVYGVQYNRKQTSGQINQLGGDRASRNYASAAFFNSAI